MHNDIYRHRYDVYIKDTHHLFVSGSRVSVSYTCISSPMSAHAEDHPWGFTSLDGTPDCQVRFHVGDVATGLSKNKL